MAALLVGLSIPLVQGKVSSNSTYGFRTSRTLANPSIWYVANRFAGQATLVVSTIMIALSVVLLLLDRYMKLGPNSLTLQGLTFEIVPLLALILVLMLCCKVPIM
ncbi:SdpI family protein [Calidithermus roseus]|uniref:SdpI family protein n=1 Tax=Calidithermus roseus TaxID=1644118 RepID=UPI0015FDF956|nr:SdpI family protein [Calidithermus roseus]